MEQIKPFDYLENNESNLKKEWENIPYTLFIKRRAEKINRN